MMHKGIGFMAALVFLLFSGLAMAQTHVLGFQLGISTYNQVKDNLPKTVKIILNRTSSAYYGGPFLATDGKGYGIKELKTIHFAFDRNQTLIEVAMDLEGWRFNDIQKILSAKYQPVHSDRNDRTIFKANRDYVKLYHHSDEISVVYMTDTVYWKYVFEERQMEESKEERKREKKKMVEREAAKEAAKF